MPTDHPDNPRRRGRPPKLTPEIALGIAQAILDGNFRNVAGKRYGISPDRFRKWMNAGRDFPAGLYGQFRWLILEAEADAELKAVAWVVAAGAGDPKHLEWWLERKFPERWGRYRGELAMLRREIADLKRMLTGEPADGQTTG